MKAIESVILGPIREDLIGHSAIFHTRVTSVETENITSVDLDGYGRAIVVTADKIKYRPLGKRESICVKQYRFHISAEYSIVK